MARLHQPIVRPTDRIALISKDFQPAHRLGKVWRPRQGSNLRPQVSYHFGFRRRREAFVVWTIPSP